MTMHPETLRLLQTIDVDGALRVCPNGPDGRPMSRLGALAGIHKARYHCPELTQEERFQSLRWLRFNNFTDLWGADLPVEDVLPS